ncbi:MAG: endopeptidase La [Candidatus Yanofskybacteria bacterium RIFCSPHIGHO2_01_FULL_39_44]|nr:MAG: endopeptidase La [Candidatus Yanofskybacteria bacterium RIFCSPHIGHO2_01_FULL_39_44]
MPINKGSDQNLAYELPLLEVGPSSMPLPGVLSQISLKNSPDLLVDIRKRRVSHIFTVMQKLNETDFPDRLFGVGVIAKIEGVSDVEPFIWVEGQTRNHLASIKNPDPEIGYWIAVPGDIIEDAIEKFFTESNGELVINPEYELLIKGLLSNLKHKMKNLISELTNYMDSEVGLLEDLYDKYGNLDFMKLTIINEFVWYTVFAIPEIDSQQKQHVIETTTTRQRIGSCLALLEINIALIQNAKKFERANHKNKKGQVRRMPINETKQNNQDNQDNSFETDDPEILKRWERYKKIKENLNYDVKKAIMEDFEHLKNTESGQADRNVFVNHLDCLLDIYSAVTTPQGNDFYETERILGESHYGLDGPKERIYDYLATKKLNPKGKAPILCLVGPPGVGKTSIARSIADSLGLKFIRLSLGGVRDEADIRGHRRTYIGAMPGQIIQSIRRVGVKNPVFLLDEVDKVTSDFRGDPSSALLEVLDPEQNHSFRDHYVDAQFDLSGVLFVCTANLESGIKPALLDRMNVINISGYTEREKVEIAKKYLIPKQLTEVGLTAKNIGIRWQNNDPDKLIATIISGYTREAGVRELERQIHKILSGWCRQYLKKSDDQKPTELIFTQELIEEFLKTPLYDHERAETTEIGEAIGLAWTAIGGDIIYVQAELFKKSGGEKGVSQTGKLLEIFREANKNALTVVKNLLEPDKAIFDKFRTHSIHLSVPDGSIPKDGPSAGITMAIAIYSELTGKLVKPYIAMTGEITVKGRIRTVGGIKSKVLAAHRDGIREIILPKKNKRDVEKISEDVKKDLAFHFVTHIKEVLPIVFKESPPA